MALMYCFLLSLATIVLAVNANAPCNCEPRYLKHYEAKGCTPVIDENSECRCPTRFNCPEINLNPDVCVLNGITYNVGQSVNTSNNCQICHCRTNTFLNGATVQCIGIECGHIFHQPPRDENCYQNYEEGHCCPTRTCTPKTPETRVCEYNGREYRIGQKIYPETDHCFICRCTENWTGVNNNSCHVFDCELGKEIYQFKRGCIPIYHEKTCCPIEYHCPPLDGSPVDETVIATESNENKCYFNRVYYDLGSELNISHPTNCVSCQCTTPPDFTCVHRSCPNPPNRNCRAQYTENSCCATYNCTQPAVDVSVEGAPSSDVQGL